MRFSFKIFLGLFLLIGVAASVFYSSFITELKPAFRQSTEESLVDVANLLAELVAQELDSGDIAEGQLAQAVQAFHDRQLKAKIWFLDKTRPNLQIYITDAQGIVRYDSSGRHVGEDFSRWNDVYLTLRGEYGVRSTLADPTDDASSVMHVAAPVLSRDRIIGVVSVQKPGLSIQPFFAAAQKNLFRKGGGLVLFALLAGLLLSFWLSKSIRQLADYAYAVSNGENATPPEVQGRELRQLSTAMTRMKEELEGKKYIEHYVNTLAHQLKTPIASIQGATELLNEKMQPVQRQRFIGNIAREALRMQQIVQYMLSLAEIENRQRLENLENIALQPLLDEIIQSQMANIQARKLTVMNQLNADVAVLGERFLLHQAIANLMDNAISFSPVAGRIEIVSQSGPAGLALQIIDQGPGIPVFAAEHVFERFYSLPRPGSRQKSSGLGLCFVKEISRLHGGGVRLTNNPCGGATAELLLPAH